MAVALKPHVPLGTTMAVALKSHVPQATPSQRLSKALSLQPGHSVPMHGLFMDSLGQERPLSLAEVF